MVALGGAAPGAVPVAVPSTKAARVFPVVGSWDPAGLQRSGTSSVEFFRSSSSGAEAVVGADDGRAVAVAEFLPKDSRDAVGPLRTTSASPEADQEVTGPATRHTVLPSTGSRATIPSGCAMTIAPWWTSHLGGS